MKKFTSKVLKALAVATIVTIPNTSAMETMCGTPYALVANRGSGDLSFVTKDGSTNFRYTLPLPTVNPEPMYVSYSRDMVYVGDRANNAVIAINAKDMMEEPTVIGDVCEGIFHQWSNEDKLVVACDIDLTVAVISLDITDVEATIDLTNQGPFSITAMQKPHDIVITPSGDAIFVSIISTNGVSSDAILKIDTNTMTVVARTNLPGGTDPHLGLSAASPSLLYSPQQNLGIVAVYGQFDLREVQAPLVVPNAHGIGTSSIGEYLYATNIAGGGAGGLVTIEAASVTSGAVLVGPGINTPLATPHNVAVTDDGFIFVTHSGATADQVSGYSTDAATGVPVLVNQYETGLNPFGIAIVQYACENDVPATSAPVTSSPTTLRPVGSKSTKKGKAGKKM